jgi:putative ABC transport system ATP-binding protein
LKDFIIFEKVSKSFDEGNKKRLVLDGIDLKIDKGEIIVMFGRSGSGKSTLLNLISGIDQVDSGKIYVDNNEITNYNEKRKTLFRRKNVGIIFQFFNLIPTLTVLENLLLPLELNSKDDKKRASELLEQVGLADRAESYPDVLSGGEQQRVAIARALVHDPDIIIADEPTGNLDLKTGEKVIKLLDELISQKNKTMLMATHSKELIGLADRIISLKSGKINSLNAEEI